MTHQAGTVASTDSMLLALETFCTTYAGYSVITGCVPSAGHVSNTHWSTVTSRIYRKTGQADIHIAYCGATGSGQPTGVFDDKTDGGSSNLTAGMIRATLDADLTGASYSWNTKSYYIGASYSGSDYKCIDSCVRPAYGATKYHFITNGDEVFVAFKMGNSGWSHFSFGMMASKAGSWTGGTYFCGTNFQVQNSGKRDLIFEATNEDSHNCFISPIGGSQTARYRGANMILHAEVSGKAYACNLSKSNTLTSDTGATGKLTDICAPFSGYQYSVANDGHGVLRTPNKNNGRSMGIPFDIFGYDTNTATWRYMGQITGMRHVNVEWIGDEEIINSDWIVFPVNNRTTRVDYYTCNTGNAGIAYKRYSLSS